VSFEKGMRLPEARLSTVGGTSFAFHELRGRPAVIFGWGSWSPSAKRIAALQEWHSKSGVALATVAFEVTGPAAAMSVLKPAGANHVMLIDATCTLTRCWGVREVPFLVAVNEDFIVLHSGTRFEEKAVSAALKARVSKTKKEPSFSPAQVKRQFQVEILLQACTNLLGRRRTAEALASLQKALDLDPENRIIAEQLRVMESKS